MSNLNKKAQDMSKLPAVRMLTPEVRHGTSQYITKPIVRLPTKSRPEVTGPMFDPSKSGKKKDSISVAAKTSPASGVKVKDEPVNVSKATPKNGVVVSKSGSALIKKSTTPPKNNASRASPITPKLALTRNSTGGVSLLPSSVRPPAATPKANVHSTKGTTATQQAALRTNSPSSKAITMTLTAASTTTVATSPQAISQVRVTTAATTIPASSAIPASYLAAAKPKTLPASTKRAFQLVSRMEEVNVPNKKLKVLEGPRPQSMISKNEIATAVGNNTLVPALNSVTRGLPATSSSPYTMVVTAADGSVTSYKLGSIVKTNPRMAFNSTGSIIRPVVATGTQAMTNVQMLYTTSGQPTLRGTLVSSTQSITPSAVVKTEPVLNQIRQTVTVPVTSLPSTQNNSVVRTRTLPMLVQDRTLVGGNKVVKSGNSGQQFIQQLSSTVQATGSSSQVVMTQETVSMLSANVTTSLALNPPGVAVVTIKEEISSPQKTVSVVNDPGKGMQKFVSLTAGMNKVKNPGPPNITATGANLQSNSQSQKQAGQQITKDRQTTGGNAPKNKSKEAITLHSEIRTLLHGFGDSAEPLQETVEMMESILKQELGGFIHLCDNYSTISCSKVLGFQEAIMTLKNNKMRVFRMYKHFGYKDWGLVKAQQVKKTGPTRYYTREITEIVRNLNLIEIGPLIDISMTDLERIVEETDEMRNAEIRARRHGTSKKFLDYSIVRAVSFAIKLPMELLQAWVTAHLHCEAKLSKDFLEILSFLLFELVAELLHISFTIQEEQARGWDLFCSNPRGVNPDTCMSAPHFQKKRKDDECNQVSEILVQASEMEAKRLTKKGASGEKRLSIMHGRVLGSGTISMSPKLKPGTLREAYIRYQSDTSCPPSSFRVRAEQLRRYIC